MTTPPLLLALCGVGDGGGWAWSSRSEAGRAVVAAALFDLARARRVVLSEDRVVLCDGGTTGDGVQDRVLGRLRAGRARAPWEWVESLGADALRHAEEWCLYTAAPGTLGRRVGEARARVARAAERPDVSDTAALAVAVLLAAARCGHLVWPTAPPDVIVCECAVGWQWVGGSGLVEWMSW